MPFGDDIENLSLYLQTKTVFQQLIQLLNDKKATRLADIIRLFYGVDTPPLTDGEIGKIYKISYQAIQVIRFNFISVFFAGEIIKKIQLSEKFQFAIYSLKNEVIYKDENVFRQKIGYNGKMDDILRYFPLYGLDVVDSTEIFGGQYFICGNGEITITRNHIKLLYYSLTTNITPISIENLYILLEQNLEKYQIEEFRLDIIENLINEHKWIETINGEVQIKYSQLLTDYQKLGRIVYENKSITLDNLLLIYNNRINNESERKSSTQDLYINVLKNRDRRFVPQGKTGIWSFSENEESLRPVKDVIAEFVKSNHWIATFEEIKNYTNQEGLNYHDNSLRSYILNICTPSMENYNLFCHKEHINEYPNYKWRSPQKYGSGNWQINTIVELLLKAPNNTLTFKDIKKFVDYKAIIQGYNSRNIRTTVKLYEGVDNLFTYDKNDNLSLNTLVLDVIDLEKVGMRNRTPPYYMELASFIINYLRNHKVGSVLLVEIMNLCKHLVPSGNTVPLYQNVVSKFSELEIVKHGERLYIQLCKTVDFIAEETHVIAIEKIIADEEVITETILESSDFVPDTRERKKINARQAVNWDELIQIMFKELSYYSRWMPMNITLQEAINKFKVFLINDENSNLSRLIPQDIYDYWTCQIDRFDKYHYLGDICTSYEKLLKSIYYNNNGIEINAGGLREIITYYPELDIALKNRDKTGFFKILNNLWTSRNIINHGEELELSNLKMDMAINEYIALYVYTIAKYAN